MGRALTVFGLLTVVLLSSARGAEPDAAPQTSKIDFQRDVAPILRQNCIDCHGPDLQMAELRLDQRQFVLGDAADPDLVKPGKSAESLLVHRLTDRKLGILMPPTFPFFPNEQVGLSVKQIELVKGLDRSRGTMAGGNWTFLSRKARQRACRGGVAVHVHSSR
jgi:hypothetical protein